MDKKTIKIILTTLAALCAIIAFCLYAAPFVSKEIGNVTIDELSGFEISFMYFDQNISDNDFGFAFMFLGFCSAVCMFLVSIIKFIDEILSMFGKQLPKIKTKKTKKLTEKDRKQAIILDCFFDILMAVITLVINLNVLNLCGLDDELFVYVGSGAIWSSVLFIIS